MEKGKGMADAIELAAQEIFEEIEVPEKKAAHNSHLRKKG
jgi:hypothetical protein